MNDGGQSQRLEEPLEEAGNKKRVAIACQGGGSHTAFTAGVLKAAALRAAAGTRGGCSEWNLRRGGVRAAGVAQPVEGRRGGDGEGSRRLLAPQLRHGAIRTGSQQLGSLGEQPSEFRRDAGG